MPAFITQVLEEEQGDRVPFAIDEGVIYPQTMD